MKVNLATTETVSANYAGEDAGRFISAALLSPTTVEGGGVDVVEGIKYKWNVPNVNLSGIVRDATCDFTAEGTLTIADRVLTPEDFEVNLQLCKRTYNPLWKSIYERGQFSGSFTDYLIALVGANIAASRESVIWTGVNATAGHFDGFQTLLTTDAGLPTANEVTGTTVTAANVVAELEKVLAAASSALYSADGFAIRIGTNIMKEYISAQAALGYLDRYNVGQTELNFQGVPLIHCAGMGDNIMIATKSDNLFYGIADYDDSGEVKVLDMSDLDASDNVRIKVRWADGIQYGNVSDIITYGIVNAAN